MMLAYAARRPVIDRRPHPNAMLLVIGAHIALVAAVMSAKMEIRRQPPEPPIIVDMIKQPTPPPPNVPATKPTARQPIAIDQPIEQVPLPPVDHPPVALGNPTVDPTPLAGGGALVIPEIRPAGTPVRSGPRLVTPESELKPPYPASKLLSEEEAVLRLKLTINEQGRIVAVDPVGRADPAFLDAARRHLIAHWRYKPASEDGRAVTSTAFITLHFELNG